MDKIDYLLLVSRWLHLAAVIVAVGGAAFTLLALMPAAKATLPDQVHARLRDVLRTRWSTIVFTCIGVLLLTGSLNFALLAMPPKVDPIPYHPIFGVKFFAAMGVFFIASALAGTAPGLAKMRERRAMWLTWLLVLAGVIVLLSGILSQIRTGNGVSRPETIASAG